MAQINWSGHTWSIRTGTGDPGPNNWSSDNVSVDAQGNLHLKITNVGGNWYCAEIYMTDPAGYGTYTINMVTNPLNPALDNNTVIGLFYWLDAQSELDIEYSRWGISGNNNLGQYSVQGTGGGASPRYYINALNSVNKMVWQSNGNINFITTDSSGNIIGSWNYTGSHKTNPGGSFAINLWLYNSNHPSDNQPKELILSSFTYNSGQTPILTTIAISPVSASINPGATQQLTAVCRDQNNNVMTCPTLTWTSNNTSIATVNSSGLVTGVATGTANITASAGGKTSNISTITVTSQPVLTTIAISPVSTSINPGATQQLTAVCRDQNNNVMTCPTLTWISNNTSIATVNSSGLVTGVATGTANITASTGGKTSNISIITVTSQPVSKIFIVSTIGCPTTTGVMVMKSSTGDHTADEACQEVCNILKTIN